jgi:long-chain acyl-CoA synthetase
VNLAAIIEPHDADAAALISRGKVTTYGELRAQVGGMRGALVDLGLEPGDRLGIICGNNWYFVVSYFAALGAGLVVVPLNPASPAPELERQLGAIGARAVVVGPTGKATFGSVDRSKLPVLEHVIMSAGNGSDDALLLDDLIAMAPTPIIERESTDLAALLFTSGTAGSPKAAMLTHGNLLTNLEQIISTPGRNQAEADVIFGVLPMFHIFGMNVILGLASIVGSTVLLIERFDPVAAIEAIEKHKVTMLSGPPNMWASWAEMPGLDRAAFASVKVAASGASKLPVEVAERIEERLGIRLREGYGMTEAGPVITMSAGTEAPFGSIGRPVPGLELRLVDDEGDDVLIGDAGEVVVRGPNIFVGYWNDADATAAALDADGWLHTGDVGVVDDDGHLYLVDRVKDLIIVSGFNVYPAEVEDVLIEHPAVVAVGVVGTDHPHTGETVRAYVVVGHGFSVEEDELISWCGDRLARYKCPTKITFVDELPRGVTGKVLRRALR